MSHEHLDGSGAGLNTQITNHPRRHCSISVASQPAQQGTVLILKNAVGMVAREIVRLGKTLAPFFFLASFLSDPFSPHTLSLLSLYHLKTRFSLCMEYWFLILQTST